MSLPPVSPGPSSSLHSRQSSFTMTPPLKSTAAIGTPPPELKMGSPSQDRRIQDAVQERGYPCGPYRNVVNPSSECATAVHTYGSFGNFHQDTYTRCPERDGKCNDGNQTCVQKD